MHGRWAQVIISFCAVSGCHLVSGADEFTVKDSGTTAGATTTGSGGQGGTGGDATAGGGGATAGGGGATAGGGGGTAIVPVSVSAGSKHSCATFSDGTARCWGRNDFGQLGDGTLDDLLFPSKLVTGITAAEKTEAGNDAFFTSWSWHSCVLLMTGLVQCWGRNSSGQLGNGTETDSNLPVDVSDIVDVRDVAPGLIHTCAALVNGTARCWGSAQDGRLGNGATTGIQNAPVPVLGVEFDSIRTIGAGRSHSCGMATSGSVYCWGFGVNGQLGWGQNNSSDTAVKVTSMNTAKELTVGNSHNCVRLSTGQGQCWGSNNTGQLGNGNNDSQNTPANIALLAVVLQISAGLDHTCAVGGDKLAYCWGLNDFGQLGNGTFGNTNKPGVVSGLSNVAAVSASMYHSCALLEDHRVFCWGLNDFGQLGIGNTEDKTEPHEVVFPPISP